MKYPLFRPPCLTGRYLERVLTSGWLTTGPECEALRTELSAAFSWPRSAIVLGSSATACFQAFLDVLGFEHVDQTEQTWPGMKHVRPHSYERDKRLSVDTQIGGAELIEPPRSGHSVRLLDACHSWLPDATYDASLVSFYPTKLVPGAEGGALFLGHGLSHLAPEIECALNCGQVPALYRGNASLLPGFGRKGNMTDVQAALNREALDLHQRYTQDIAVAWELLRCAAESYDVPYRAQPGRAYLFQVKCASERVQFVRELLALGGVSTAWNFSPAPLVTCPCFPGLTESDADYIMLRVKEAL